MESCYISMQHYAAVNHICNALKHNAEVEVYGENKKGEMPKKENARAYFLAFDDVEKVDFQEFPEDLFTCINPENLNGKTVYEFYVKERNRVVHAVQVVVEDDFCPSSYDVARLIQARRKYGTLSCEDLTHGMNGYPQRVRAILVGFDSVEDAETVAEEFGVHVDVFRKRDGWHFWEKAGTLMSDAYETECREDVYKYAVGVDCTQLLNE